MSTGGRPGLDGVRIEALAPILHFKPDDRADTRERDPDLRGFHVLPHVRQRLLGNAKQGGLDRGRQTLIARQGLLIGDLLAGVLKLLNLEQDGRREPKIIEHRQA